MPVLENKHVKYINGQIKVVINKIVNSVAQFKKDPQLGEKIIYNLPNLPKDFTLRRLTMNWPDEGTLTTAHCVVDKKEINSKRNLEFYAGNSTVPFMLGIL